MYTKKPTLKKESTVQIISSIVAYFVFIRYDNKIRSLKLRFIEAAMAPIFLTCSQWYIDIINMITKQLIISEKATKFKIFTLYILLS